jgi:hypothetical protein
VALEGSRGVRRGRGRALRAGAEARGAGWPWPLESTGARSARLSGHLAKKAKTARLSYHRSLSTYLDSLHCKIIDHTLIIVTNDVWAASLLE